MITRWPVHPRPIPGEALTSWLHRIADRYGITLDDLAFDIGHSLERDTDLDLAPPDGLIEQLAIRTGVSSDRIHPMSISGYTPWLLDDIEPGPDMFSTYLRAVRSNDGRHHTGIGPAPGCAASGSGLQLPEPREHLGRRSAEG